MIVRREIKLNAVVRCQLCLLARNFSFFLIFVEFIEVTSVNEVM